MVNNRRDRVMRMEQFLKFSLENEKDFEKIFISGENKEIFYKKLKEKNMGYKIQTIETIDTFERLEENAIIIAVGNICGIGKEIVQSLENKRNEEKLWMKIS